MNLDNLKAVDAVEKFIGADFENQEGVITMHCNDTEMIKMKPNGNFYVKGNLTANDVEVYEGFKEFIYQWSQRKS